jgi:hypothetical protein
MHTALKIRLWSLRLIAPIILCIFIASGSDAQECSRYSHWLKCGNKYTHVLGDTYKGQFSRNNPNGVGIINYKGKSKHAGDRYEGEFYDGILHGEGIYFHKNGDVFRGTWSGGAKNGPGLKISGVRRFEEVYDFGVLISSSELMSPSLKIEQKTRDIVASKPPVDIKKSAPSKPTDFTKPISKYKSRIEPKENQSKSNESSFVKNQRTVLSNKKDNIDFLLACLTIISLIFVYLLISSQKSKQKKSSQSELPMSYSQNDEEFASALKRVADLGKTKPRVQRAMQNAYEGIVEKKSIEQDGLKASFFNTIEKEKMGRLIQRKKQKMMRNTRG